jgi:hypothetical protein
MCLLVTDRRYDPAPRTAGKPELGMTDNEETVSQSRRRLRDSLRTTFRV